MQNRLAWAWSLVFLAGCIAAMVQGQDYVWRPSGAPTAEPPHMGERPFSPPAELNSPAVQGARPILGLQSGEAQLVQATEEPRTARAFPRTMRRVQPETQPNQQPTPLSTTEETVPSEPTPAASPFAQPGAARTPPPRIPVGGLNPVAPPQPLAAEPELGSFAPDAELPPAPTPNLAPPPAEGLRSVLKRGASPLSPPPLGAEASPSDAPPAVGSGLSSSRRAPGLAGPEATTPARPSAGSPGYTPRNVQDISATGSSASLRVDISGPQAITAGKNIPYVVTLTNDSGVAAADVAVRISLPDWVSVASGASSSGVAEVRNDAQGAGRLVWTLPALAAQARETLKLQILASQGQPFELLADWACRPAAVKAAIVVRQPQLEIEFDGPGEMAFGEEETYVISVLNPGSGDAENVILTVSSGGARPQQMPVGVVPAGQKKDLKVRIAATQAGEMEIRAVAAGDGGLSTEALGKVTVRQAKLDVALGGPPTRFAGAEAVYQVVIANSGDASADNVAVAVALPAGAKYLGGVQGATASGGAVKWKVDRLEAGAETSFEVRMQLFAGGANRVIAQVQSPASPTTGAQFDTEVEAAADLKLVVNDPAGPLLVGAETTYELRLMNRGTNSAQNVRIVMQFGEGVEPIAVEGGEAKIVPGQVIFNTLDNLDAGEQVVVKVKAQSDRAGAMPYRVEVRTSEGQDRLVTEGSSRFYDNSQAPSTAKRPTLLPQGAPPATLQR